MAQDSSGNAPAPNPTPFSTQQQPEPVTAGALPFWQSQQFKGLLATLIVAILGVAAHFVPRLATITYTEVLGWINDITSVLVALGLLWAMVQRARSQLQPLTWSKGAAAAHPSTQAILIVQSEMRQAGIPTSGAVAAQIVQQQAGDAARAAAVCSPAAVVAVTKPPSENPP